MTQRQPKAGSRDSQRNATQPDAQRDLECQSSLSLKRFYTRPDFVKVVEIVIVAYGSQCGFLECGGEGGILPEVCNVSDLQSQRAVMAVDRVTDKFA